MINGTQKKTSAHWCLRLGGNIVMMLLIQHIILIYNFSIFFNSNMVCLNRVLSCTVTTTCIVRLWYRVQRSTDQWTHLAVMPAYQKCVLFGRKWFRRLWNTSSAYDWYTGGASSPSSESLKSLIGTVNKLHYTLTDLTVGVACTAACDAVHITCTLLMRVDGLMSTCSFLLLVEMEAASNTGVESSVSQGFSWALSDSGAPSSGDSILVSGGLSWAAASKSATIWNGKWFFMNSSYKSELWTKPL